MLALAIVFRALLGAHPRPRLDRADPYPGRPIEMKCFGGHGGGGTPGPIPNPEVKPSSADGTALETEWESRSLPRLRDGRAAREGGPSAFPYAASHVRCLPQEGARRPPSRRARPAASLARSRRRSGAPRRPGRNAKRCLGSHGRSSSSIATIPKPRLPKPRRRRPSPLVPERFARCSGSRIYGLGRWQEALTELKAYKRISGRPDQNHLIADSLRGLGRPADAVPLAEEVLRVKGVPATRPRPRR